MLDVAAVPLEKLAALALLHGRGCFSEHLLDAEEALGELLYVGPRVCCWRGCGPRRGCHCCSSDARLGLQLADLLLYLGVSALGIIELARRDPISLEGLLRLLYSFWPIKC